jgi:hypothetical protein
VVRNLSKRVEFGSLVKNVKSVFSGIFATL